MLETLTQHRRAFVLGIIGALMLTALSAFAYSSPSNSPYLFVIVIALAFVGSCWTPRFCLYVLAVDIVISSMGRLLEVSLFGVPISLRMGLFAVVLVVGLLEWIRSSRRGWRNVTGDNNSRISSMMILSCAFGLVLLLGVLNGWAHDYPITIIVQDANNYFFFALLLVLPILLRQKDHVRQLFAVILGAVTALWIETFTLFVMFSHRVVDLAPIYRFTRDTRIAEVTIQNAGWVRVFFQSHVFGLLLLWISLLCLPLLWKERHPDRWLWTWIAFSSSSMVIISFSRSFWAAAVMGIVLVIFMGLLRRRIVDGVMKPLLIAAGSVVVSVGFVWGLIQLPFPSGPDLTIGSVQDRATELEGEAALGSRFQLLKPLENKILEAPLLGSGFGTSVTYETQDPRFISVNGSRHYTTFVFEWGYLDTVTEIGIVGLLVYLLLLLAVGRRLVGGALTQASERAMLDGCVISLAVLAATHAVTPYLNHPLGIFWVLLLIAIGMLWNPRSVLERRS